MRSQSPTSLCGTSSLGLELRPCQAKNMLAVYRLLLYSAVSYFVPPPLRANRKMLLNVILLGDNIKLQTDVNAGM